MTTRFPDLWTPPVARTQLGVFRPDQAIAAGMTRAQVRRRRDTGRWVVVAGSALTHLSQPIDPWRRAWGAWITWPDSVACLGTAALLHQLPVADDGVAHVLVPTPRAPRHRLMPHEHAVNSTDVANFGRLRATTLHRTIVDCLGRFDDRRSEELMIWVLTRELITRADLEESLASHPGQRGNARRRRALADTATGAFGAGERRLHAILTGAYITGGAADQKILDERGIVGRADVFFPAVRLVLEVDGLAYHGTDRFQADRTRQNRLVNAGCTVLRFTWRDLTDRPNDVVAQVLAALRRLGVEVPRER